MQHEGICAFPSVEFYEKKLKTWQGLRRPPSILGHVGKESCSVIFGHVQGHEQSLLVSTDEGNENSKANPEEVAAVVSACETFLVPQGQGGLPGGGGRGTEGTARPWCPGQERRLGQLQQHPLVPQVRIAKQLTLGRTVEPKDVAILTPYNAQAAEISKRLVREGVSGVTVCSITKSQGEGGPGAGGACHAGPRVGEAPGQGLMVPAPLQEASGATCW